MQTTRLLRRALAAAVFITSTAAAGHALGAEPDDPAPTEIRRDEPEGADDARAQAERRDALAELPVGAAATDGSVTSDAFTLASSEITDPRHDVVNGGADIVAAGVDPGADGTVAAAIVVDVYEDPYTSPAWTIGITGPQWTFDVDLDGVGDYDAAFFNIQGQLVGGVFDGDNTLVCDVVTAAVPGSSGYGLAFDVGCIGNPPSFNWWSAMFYDDVSAGFSEIDEAPDHPYYVGPVVNPAHSPTPTGPTCAGLAATIVGTNGNDTLRGTGGRDVIVAKGGNDLVLGFGGDDVICLGNGNDRVNGHAGSDRIIGGSGRDTVVFGGAPRGVRVDLAAGTAVGWGADTLNTIENVEGSTKNDRLRGNAGPNRLVGGRGSDLIDGRGGSDTALGGDGPDELRGGGGNDTLNGGAKDDVVLGGGGNDTLDGAGGNDLMDGGAGADVMRGRVGADAMFGGGGDDRMLGHGGADSLFGGDGSDVLDGGPRRDLCHGQTGVDRAVRCEVVADVP